MTEFQGKVRLQDAVLANMVTLSAILEYLDQMHPGAKDIIDRRAVEIAHNLKASQPSFSDQDADHGQD
ncbi:MAG: hypothetical protein KJ050_06085 [Candidatus Omnitrophica bacterium]|nr:MAG: hypothetical protein UZ16_OP3001002575 [Candidatus Hinthialibacteria bacterium OLB16]MBE7487500.1 hypothetical protein [bacterium]MBK7494198.1 hypothetical protein [Candidatus Omnitrophota bacterium]MBV6480803.1 hypothetical protein [bacterium]MCC6732043.1 hypothetical protein [Candidatus Omnitrophota bacterium]